MNVRRSRATQQGAGRYGEFLLDAINLARADDDTVGFLRIEDRPDERPFAYMPALPAIGIDAHIGIWQFNNAYHVNTTNVWTQVNSGSGTALTVQDTGGRGGVAKVVNAATDNSYYGYFSKYSVAKLQASKGLWMHMLLGIKDVDQADWFFGLCGYVASAGLFDSRRDSIGFYGVDGSANINCETAKDTTATQSTAKGTLSDYSSTFKELGIFCNGTSGVYFYISDASGKLSYVATHTTNLPDDQEINVAFGIRNGQAAANELTTGRIILIQDI